MPLKEFLEQQANWLGAGAEARKAKRDDWLGAVGRLLSQIEGWLLEADTGRILQIWRTGVERSEEEIGYYQADELIVRLVAREVRITPFAFSLVGPFGVETWLGQDTRAQGRVDMSNGEEKYFLYRYARAEGDLWGIVHEDERVIRKLDRESFEAAIQRLLE